MYPKAEETIILDVLATVENNVQKASEQLSRMGFEKKELTPAPRLSHRKKDEGANGSVRKQAVIEPTPPPKPKSADEKKKCEYRVDRVLRNDGRGEDGKRGLIMQIFASKIFFENFQQKSSREKKRWEYLQRGLKPWVFALQNTWISP